MRADTLSSDNDSDLPRLWQAERILNKIPVACFELDQNSCFTYINQHAEILFARSKNTMLGKSIWEEFPETIQAHCFIAITKAIKQQEISTSEYISAITNTWIRLSTIPSQSGVIVLATEIEETKHIQLQLKEEQRRLKSAQKIGKMGYFERHLGEEKLYWSDELYRIHGLEPQSEIITLDKVVAFIHPDDQEIFYQTVQDALLQKTSFEITNRIIRTDGQVRIVSRRMEFLIDSKGVIDRMYGVVQDITEQKQIEEKQKASDSLMKQAEQAAGLGSYEGELPLQSFHFSDGMFRLLGYEPHGFTPTLDFIDSISNPEDAIEVLQIITKAIETKQPYQYLRRVYWPTGEMHYIFSRGKVICDDKGNPIKILGMAQDVTEQKNAQAEIDKQANFIRQITEAIPGTISIYDLEQEQIVYINRKQFTRFGYSDQELNEMTDWRWITKIVHPEDRRLLWQLLDEMPATLTDVVRRVDYRVQHKDGTLEWRRIRAKVFKRSESGAPLQYINLIQNITEEKQSESQITESQELLESIFNVSLSGISVFKTIRDELGEIIDFEWSYANKKAKEYAGNRELTGKRYAEEYPGIKEAGIFDRYIKVIEQDISDDFEVYYTYQGFECWFRLVTVKLGDGLVTSSEDITERKKSELKLSQILEAQTQQMQDKYYSLFNSISDGFCIIEMIWNEAGEPVDYRFLEVNPAFEKHTGIKDAVGKTMKEIEPNHESHWFQIYGEVAKTRNPVQFEEQAQALIGGWYEVNAFAMNESNKVAVLFRNITQRKQTEQLLHQSQEKQAFLLRVTDLLRTLDDPKEIYYQAARLVGEYLGANRVGYAEDRGDNATSVITCNYIQGVSGIEGIHQYNDYGTELLRAFHEGRIVIRNDVANDPYLTESEKKAYEVSQVGATIGIPQVKDQRLISVFFVHYQQAHVFSSEEISLLEETAKRIWKALERINVN
ncbi:PAS domain-containing protein [Cytophagaceae bacterium DM2B3-1]|uniref:histidine kinase n=1 Tax=Xanthocytophaga flava TaxID=3048013 RepID=A0ABT7CHF5_9BACT|nr:PAS domain-containing protein [Xanthocytophaga flavus]MDJ1470771.1 PAS domain-containing protein [Xanthocytophaga flavus]MDJ1493170.1 PAS domain-containing protein [Xanthocytophaga flavus]